MDTVLDLIVDNNMQAGTAIFAVIPFSFNLCMYLKGSFSLQIQDQYRFYSSVQNTALKAHSLCR